MTAEALPTRQRRYLPQPRSSTWSSSSRKTCPSTITSAPTRWLERAGEPQFTALPGTPEVNGLNSILLTANPNSTNSANGTGATNPFRLDRSQAATADQNHAYPAEQAAFDQLQMDLFPKNTGSGCTATTCASGGSGAFGTRGLVMGYYDGNTVTALWNYAQHYALNDNSFNTTFGPSTPGALNLVSGQTNGAIPGSAPSRRGLANHRQHGLTATLAGRNGGYTDIDDADPDRRRVLHPEPRADDGKNIGDLLNARGHHLGLLRGRLRPTVNNANGTTGCKRTTTSTVTSATKVDYIPHHEPFQYYASTANPSHTRPASPVVVGTSNDGGANHQYDIHDFFDALAVGNLPAVSFLKAPGYQDGHAGYSDPLDEQAFVYHASTPCDSRRNGAAPRSSSLYDDSDGWYDHANSIVNGSKISVAGFDTLGPCTSASTPVLPGVTGGAQAQGRCGYGPRLPLLAISPYAKQNYVDHTLTDQSSVLRFIEDNWLGGQRIAGSFDAIAGAIVNMFNFSATANTKPYLLNTSTGQPQ